MTVGTDARGDVSLIRIFREDPWLAFFTALLTVAVLLPLAQTPILPLNDLPNHVAMSALLRHILEGDATAAHHFMVQPHPAPYWLTYLLLLVASSAMPVLLAAKVVVGVAMVLTPLGTMRLLQALGRSPRMGLWAFALVWDFNLSMGFLAHTFTFGLALFFVARCVEVVDGPRASRRGLVATVLLGLLLAQSHGHVSGMASVSVFALALAELPDVRRAFRFAALSSVPTLGLVPWLLLGSGSERRTMPERAVDWPDMGERMTELFHLTLDLLPAEADRNVTGLAVIVLLVLPLLMRTKRERDPLPGRRAVALYVSAWVLYLVMPSAVFYPFEQILINERHATQILLFGLLIPDRTFRGREALWLAPGIAIALSLSFAITEQCRAFSREVEPFLAVVERVEPGSRIAWVLWDRHTPESVRETIPQVPAYLLAEKGGYSPYLFQTPNLPLRYREDRHLPHPHWHHPGQFTMHQHGQHYDYVLVQGKTRDRLRPGPIRGTNGGVAARVVLESGRWRLYAIERRPEDGT